MRTAWISGWAVPPEHLLATLRSVWPADEHHVVPAAPDALARIERLAGQHALDLIGGYSLGSHLLLREPERVNRLGAQVLLLAPVFSFVREEDLGGKAGRTQVRYLRRWLRSDPIAALRDFYLRADLDIVPEDLAPMADLDWGLEQLELGRVNPPAPAGWRLVCGEVDDLLTASRLAEISPGVVVVPGVGHQPGGLLRAAGAPSFQA